MPGNGICIPAHDPVGCRHIETSHARLLDWIILTHMHPDHIGGVIDTSGPAMRGRTPGGVRRPRSPDESIRLGM
ncbi:MBL fold metallo-hydrolase [Candidatus Darwinibacter acetoxidans]